MEVSVYLCRYILHIFDKYPIAAGGVVDKDVSDGTDEFAVLDNGAS